MSRPIEERLTESVLARLRSAPDARTRTVLESLVRHLHGFVREVEPTQAEWLKAIQFLTATGHKCDERRQEFILLSDILGVSMLVDAINHRFPAGATESTVLGPFFVEECPELPAGADLTEKLAGERGEHAHVSGRVLDTDGRPVAGARVDVWQVRPDGLYDVQDADYESAGMQLRGAFRTDAEGRFHFRTAKPVSYPVPTDGPVGELLRASGRHAMRPAHLHFMVRARGFAPLVTHLFVRGDPYIDSDAVFGVKDSLVVDFKSLPEKEAKEKNLRTPAVQLKHDFRLAREEAGRQP